MSFRNILYLDDIIKDGLQNLIPSHATKYNMYTEREYLESKKPPTQNNATSQLGRKHAIMVISNYEILEPKYSVGMQHITYEGTSHIDVYTNSTTHMQDTLYELFQLLVIREFPNEHIVDLLVSQFSGIERIDTINKWLKSRMYLTCILQ